MVQIARRCFHKLPPRPRLASHLGATQPCGATILLSNTAAGRFQVQLVIAHRIACGSLALHEAASSTADNNTPRPPPLAVEFFQQGWRDAGEGVLAANSVQGDWMLTAASVRCFQTWEHDGLFIFQVEALLHQGPFSSEAFQAHITLGYGAVPSDSPRDWLAVLRSEVEAVGFAVVGGPCPFGACKRLAERLAACALIGVAACELNRLP